MRKSWIFAFSLGLAAVGIRAAEQAPPVTPQPGNDGPGIPRSGPEGDPAPQPGKTVRVVGVRTLYREVTTPDGKVLKEPYQAVVYSDREAPTKPEEIAALREELNALNQKRVERLKPAALLEELEQERARAHSQEGWDKLQAIRKQLDEIAVQYEGTASGTAAVEAINLISNAGSQPQPQPGPRINLLPREPQINLILPGRDSAGREPLPKD